MGTLAIVALVAAGVWLGILTATIVLLVRQLALVTLWVQERSAVGEDGLGIGAEVPESSRALTPELDAGLGYLLFLGGDCQPCREFALEARKSREFKELRGTVALLAAVSGPEPQAEEVARMLPDWVRVLRGDEAEKVKEDLEVRTTPSVYEVERGAVTGRAVAGYGLENFLNLVEARGHSDAARFAGPERPPDLAVHGVAESKSGGG